VDEVEPQAVEHRADSGVRRCRRLFFRLLLFRLLFLRLIFLRLMLRLLGVDRWLVCIGLPLLGRWRGSLDHECLNRQLVRERDGRRLCKSQEKDCEHCGPLSKKNASGSWSTSDARAARVELGRDLLCRLGMTKLATVGLLPFLLAATGASLDAQSKSPAAHQKTQDKGHEKELSAKERRDFIRRAKVWLPTNVASMDLRAGPQGPGAFPPDALVTCDYVDHKLEGSSRKFSCAIDEDDVAKVRYGAANGEVQGSVLASRLLWALGFGADRVYPVRVRCRGCSSDPWTNPSKSHGEETFDRAVIERKPLGHEVKAEKDSGWAWTELDLVDESAGGATKAERDGLTLLAVLMQHTDSKPEQQRLLCLPKGMAADGTCEKPFLIVHDVGLTFGHANYSNGNDESSVNFEAWSKTPVWRDAEKCVGHISRSHTGTLADPKIGEAGRAFLAGLLQQLTDAQLRDLFAVAGVEGRSRNPGGAVATGGASVDEWIAAFKQKREQIVAVHCPS
jgi:hypothetical protein